MVSKKALTPSRIQNHHHYNIQHTTSQTAQVVVLCMEQGVLVPHHHRHICHPYTLSKPIGNSPSNTQEELDASTPEVFYPCKEAQCIH